MQSRLINADLRPIGEVIHLKCHSCSEEKHFTQDTKMRQGPRRRREEMSGTKGIGAFGGVREIGKTKVLDLDTGPKSTLELTLTPERPTYSPI